MSLVVVVCGAALASAALVVIAAQPAPSGSSTMQTGESQSSAPRRVVVTLRGGDEISGELVEESATSISLRVSGIVTRIGRDQITKITPLRSLRERYQSMRAIIDDNDIDRLLVLAEWLQRNGLLNEAIVELRHILELAPTDVRATELKAVVDHLVDLRKSKRASASDNKSSDSGRSAGRPAAMIRPGSDVFPLLSSEEINRIKVYEVDLDNPPQMRIERSTLERLLKAHAGDELLPQSKEGREAFLHGEARDALRAMFQLRARDLYDKVQVLELPDALQRFRNDVHASWLMNACATTRCHGGLEAGDFILYTRKRNSEQTVLTNFLIVDRFRTRTGARLINYDAPESSRLLQMALPPAVATTPHPDVRGWRPLFLSQKDRRFRQAISWISAMHIPRPDYQIDFDPPTAAQLKGVAPTAGPDR